MIRFISKNLVHACPKLVHILVDFVKLGINFCQSLIPAVVNIRPDNGSLVFDKLVKAFVHSIIDFKQNINKKLEDNLFDKFPELTEKILEERE